MARHRGTYVRIGSLMLAGYGGGVEQKKVASPPWRGHYPRRMASQQGRARLYNSAHAFVIVS